MKLQPEQKFLLFPDPLGLKKVLSTRHFISGFSVRIICSVPVVSPLKNIVEDQMKKCQSWAFRRLRFENPNTNK